MERQRIGFIGLGAMGLGMASRLAESGYQLAVYNRTRAKSEQVGELGARVADSPADAARDADVVMLSLADQHVVEAMLFDGDGVAGSAPQGTLIVDLSTVSPDFSRETAERAQDAGYRALDACVLGNPEHARQGELRVMVGGDEEDFREAEPILEAIGKQVVYYGGHGMGATMKLVLNMLMGVQMPALAEAVIFGERAGLPREKILAMIAGSGYSSPMMSFRCPMMAQRQFQRVAFKLALMDKDMRLVLDEARERDVPMPVAEAAHAALESANEQGLGDFDVSAILAYQERLAGVEGYPWPEPGPPGGGPPGGRPGAGGPPPGARPGGPPS
jgi:3-hydroxyisobutyrate dehydrogenase